jgi:hypothetical protein
MTHLKNQPPRHLLLLYSQRTAKMISVTRDATNNARIHICIMIVLSCLPSYVASLTQMSVICDVRG